MTGPNIPSRPVWIGDLGWVSAGRFYFADISNKQVDVLSARRLRFLGAVSGFVSPSGIATVGSTVWVTDGDRAVKILDSSRLRIRASIATHGNARADDLALDPVDNVVVVVNPGDQPPFLTFINANTRTIAGRLSLRGATDVGQPIWDAERRMFFVPVATAKAERFWAYLRPPERSSGPTTSRARPRALFSGPGRKRRSRAIQAP